MTDDLVVTPPQAGSDDSTPQPQAGASIPPTEPQAGDSQTPSSDTISLDEAKKLRQEANALRKRLKAFEDAEAKAAVDKLSEKERLEKQIADLQKAHDAAIKQSQETRISAEIRLQAQSLGIAPDLAEKLIDRAAILDDEGNPTNVGDALKALAKTYPMLVSKSAPAAAPTGGGATNPSKSQSSTPPALSDDYIAKLMETEAGRAEYLARRPEIQKYRADNPFRYGHR
jgi:hypothetical protein